MAVAIGVDHARVAAQEESVVDRVGVVVVALHLMVALDIIAVGLVIVGIVVAIEEAPVALV